MECVEDDYKNRNKIVIEVFNTHYCFSVEEVRSAIRKRPYYVHQISVLNEVTGTNYLLARQQLPQFQVIKLGEGEDVLWLDYSFIELFNKNYNTFSVVEVNGNMLFKSELPGEFNIDADVYKVSLVPRNEFDAFPENEEIEEKFIFEEDSKTVILEEKEDPLKTIFLFRQSLDPFFNSQNIKYNNDLIIIYDESDIKTVFCYTFEELSKYFLNISTVSDDTASGRICIYENYIFVRLPLWNIRIEIFSLLNLLQGGMNTIRLYQMTLDDDLVYYIALSSSRRVFFPDENIKNNILDSEYYITCIPICKKGEEFYINKIIEGDDDFISRTSWIKFKPNKSVERTAYMVSFRHLTSNIPTMTDFMDGTMIMQHWLDDDKQLHRDDDEPALLYESLNGHDTIQEWWRHGLKHRDGDKPAIIASHSENWPERIKHIEEQWWTDGKRNRANGQPAVIARDGEEKSDRVYFKEWWVDNVPERRVQVEPDGTEIEIPFENQNQVLENNVEQNANIDFGNEIEDIDFGDF